MNIRKLLMNSVKPAQPELIELNASASDSISASDNDYHELAIDSEHAASPSQEIEFKENDERAPLDISTTTRLLQRLIDDGVCLNLPQLKAAWGVAPDKADFSTYYTTFWEGAGYFLNNTLYWSQFIGSFDSILDLPEWNFSVSKPALFASLLIGVASTLGASYIHFILNTNHQHARDASKALSPEGQRQLLANVKMLYTGEIPKGQERDYIRKHLNPIMQVLLSEKIVVAQEQLSVIPPTKLSWWQKLCIPLDFLTHISDNATTPGVIYNLTIKKPSLVTNIIAQSVNFGLGASISKTTIRTCTNNLLFFNRTQEAYKKQDQNDINYDLLEQGMQEVERKVRNPSLQ